MTTDPILIVGAGPTGLMAAFELSRLGLPVRLIDKRDGPATTSRAIGVQARTLELLDQRGLAEELASLGHKADHGSVYGGGSRIFRVDFAKVDSPYPFMLFVSQVETERLLREALAKTGIIPEWGVELTGLAQNALSRSVNPVSAILARADGSTERFDTPWLIGAEGAHSLTRSTLDLPFEGKTLDEQYALGDLQIEGDLPDSDFHIFSSEHGFMALFPLGGRRFRMIAGNPFGAPETERAPSEAELQRLYDQRSPIAARLHDTVWTSWFRINSRMVTKLRAGRLLLGGDSAHIHSPAGAQGMNTGLQDMINLSWKLALVVQGKAPPALLDTYEQDRLGVIRGVLFRTETLTEAIGTHNPIVRSLFDRLGPWIGGADLVQENATNRIAQLLLNYRHSPLSENHLHAGNLRAGDRVPDFPVRHRRNGAWYDAALHGLLDPSGFVLLVAHKDESVPLDDRLPATLTGSSVPISLIELAPAPDGRKHFQAEFGSGSNVFLVRPDGYVGLAAGPHMATRVVAPWIERWLSLH